MVAERRARGALHRRARPGGRDHAAAAGRLSVSERTPGAPVADHRALVPHGPRARCRDAGQGGGAMVYVVRRCRPRGCSATDGSVRVCVLGNDCTIGQAFRTRHGSTGTRSPFGAGRPVNRREQDSHRRPAGHETPGSGSPEASTACFGRLRPAEGTPDPLRWPRRGQTFSPECVPDVNHGPGGCSVRARGVTVHDVTRTRRASLSSDVHAS